MSTLYLEILAIAEPFDIGPDALDFQAWSCNYEALARAPIAALGEEIAKLISDAGLGTLGVDLFVGSKAPIPKDGDGPYSTVVKYGGVPPLETQNGTKLERPAFQVVTRARSSAVAEARALAIFRELDGTRNVTVAA